MNPLLKTFFRLTVYCALMFLCTLPMQADFLTGTANESNAIEYTQHIILFITVLIGFASLFIIKEYKIFMSVLSLFILMHLIREFDAWFDGHLGGWFPYALIVAAVLLLVFIKNLNSFITQLNKLKETLGFGILLISLANLHVFTRLYGKPSNWDAIMGDKYLYSIERISEESVELIAYIMILIAVLELVIFVKVKTHNVTA